MLNTGWRQNACGMFNSWHACIILICGVFDNRYACKGTPERFWEALGRSCKALESTWALQNVPGTLQARSGRLWGVPGSSWEALERSRKLPGCCGTLWGGSGMLQEAPGRLKDVPGSSWEALGQSGKLLGGSEALRELLRGSGIRCKDSRLQSMRMSRVKAWF